MPKTLYEIVEKYRKKPLECNDISIDKFDVYLIHSKIKKEEFKIDYGFMIFCNSEKLFKEKRDGELKKYKVGKKEILYKHRYYAYYRIVPNTKKRKTLSFILFNPSTANPDKLDDTITNCLILANKEGYAQVEILNLFSYRNSSVKKECVDENGLNEKFLMEFIKKRKNACYVLAWGHGKENDNDFSGLIKKVKEKINSIKVKSIKMIGIDVKEANKYNHHPEPRVWNSMGKFKEVAKLIKYKKGV